MLVNVKKPEKQVIRRVDMICKRCQHSLRSEEVLKCGMCPSCMHPHCCHEPGKETRNAGDKDYKWKCSLCQSYVSNVRGSSGSETSKDKNYKTLMHVVNALNDKFEMVNKIQLPKLTSNLANIKLVAERIAEQTESILGKIENIDGIRKSDGLLNDKGHTMPRYRKRSVNFTSKVARVLDDEDTLTVPEKTARYRTRRRSYLLNRIFTILNRKKKRRNTSASPRKRY